MARYLCSMTFLNFLFFDTQVTWKVKFKTFDVYLFNKLVYYKNCNWFFSKNISVLSAWIKIRVLWFRAQGEPFTEAEISNYLRHILQPLEGLLLYASMLLKSFFFYLTERWISCCFIRTIFNWKWNTASKWICSFVTNFKLIKAILNIYES